MNYGHILKFRQRLRQDGRQPVIQLDRHHLFRPAAQLCRQHAKARSDLQHPHTGGGTAQLRHFGAYARVDDKILSQRAGKGKPMALQQLLDDSRIGKCGHGGLLAG